LENLKGRDLWGDLDIDGRIGNCEVMDGIHLVYGVVAVSFEHRNEHFGFHKEWGIS
jgi:hypothetical protein